VECLGRLQRPECEISATGALRDPEALARAEVRLRQHLLDLRAAVPGIPRLLLRRLSEVASNDVDEGYASPADRSRPNRNASRSGIAAYGDAGRMETGLPLHARS